VAFSIRKGIFMTDKVEIYTDGACRGNPGPGGWGVVLRYKGTEKELSGYAPATTNNRMELQAAIEGLKALTRPAVVDLYTDSLYLRDGITKWLQDWKKKNWISSSKNPVKNKDLWEDLDLISQKHDISWHWVRGHRGHPENERADCLARNVIKKHDK
jgi:ribonuclease HI